MKWNKLLFLSFEVRAGKTNKMLSYANPQVASQSNVPKAASLQSSKCLSQQSNDFVLIEICSSAAGELCESVNHYVFFIDSPDRTDTKIKTQRLANPDWWTLLCVVVFLCNRCRNVFDDNAKYLDRQWRDNKHYLITGGGMKCNNSMDFCGTVYLFTLSCSPKSKRISES